MTSALPTREAAGQVSPAKSTRVQTVPMWLLSRSSPFGRVTETVECWLRRRAGLSTAWIAG